VEPAPLRSGIDRSGIYDEGCSDISDAPDQPDRSRAGPTWWRNEPGSCGELPRDAV